MKRYIISFIIVVSIIAGISLVRAQSYDGDIAPSLDGYFQYLDDDTVCVNGECDKISDLSEDYVPSDNVIDTLDEERWFWKQVKLYLDLEQQKAEGTMPLDTPLEGCEPPSDAPTCFTAYSINSTGGCSGTSCGAAAREYGLPTDELNLWGKYKIELCYYKTNSATWISPEGKRIFKTWHKISSLYSIADKCSNDSTPNRCSVGDKGLLSCPCLPGNSGLWAGSCEGGAGGFYKCCCDNQALTPVSSIPDKDPNDIDNYPPSEGVCPSGSFISWKNGAEINPPSECQNLCKNPRNCTDTTGATIPCPETEPNYCYTSDLPTDHPTCKYDTLKNLEVDPNLVLQFKVPGSNPHLEIETDISKEECSFLCEDLYYCDFSDPTNPEPLSIRGRFTSRDECVGYLDTDPSAPASTKDCFTKSDPAYDLCSPQNPSLVGGGDGDGQGERPYFYCSTESGYSCEKTPQSFADKTSCEAYIKSNNLKTSDGKCYLLEGDCKANCPKGPTVNYHWCNPAGGGCLGPQPYTSKLECDEDHGTCYPSFGSCFASCQAVTPSSGTCGLPADSNPGDIDLTINASKRCVPEGTSTTIDWDASASDSLCGVNDRTENVSLSCKSICGGWVNQDDIKHSDSRPVSPTYFSAYGINCRLTYDCCHDDTIDVGNPHPCLSDPTKMCQDTTTKPHCVNHSASESAKTDVKVVGKPTFELLDASKEKSGVGGYLTATPTDILYTDIARSSTYKKYSKLKWDVSVENLGSKTSLSCTPGIKGLGDNTGWTGSLSKEQIALGFRDVAPARTTVYTLRCKNKDDKAPIVDSCFSNSDTKEATVRVFGTGIEEKKPQSLNTIDFGQALGNIIRALTPFGR